MAQRTKKLTAQQVEELIQELLTQGRNVQKDDLLIFAQKINGGPFKAAKAPSQKALSMTAMKKAVLEKFDCKTVTELRKNKTFAMAFTSQKVSLKSTDDWKKQYRIWVAVPEDERNKTGATCINGIDVLENFRPWHVFDLNAETAKPEDIKESFRRLAKNHHPDMGGDSHVFERLQKMRDSLLALIN